MAPVMLPHLRGRPVTLERFPAGITKKGFIQKDVVKGFPDWLERVAVAKRTAPGDPPVHYALASDARALVWMANQNSVTPHVWCARVPELDRPDVCVFDLDPEADDLAALRTAARHVRDLLAELELPAFVKTSGSKGFHILVPLAEDADFDTSWRFALGAGALLVKRHPGLLTQEFIREDRGGRIFLDTGRNAPGATFAAAYAVRARPQAPVSAPCTWAEVEAVGPRTFTLRGMAERVAEVGDLWEDMAGHARSLRAPLAEVGSRLSAEDWAEALAATTRRPRSRRR
jgi:bifunctional non-homologous end joining protein LigD